MHSAILIDDEIHCTESLELILAQAAPQIKVTAKFNDSVAALNYLQLNRVDLIFLDIEMPGMNGFELLGALKNLSFDVVFVTAYDQYAIKAFTYSAVNYLLKPVDEEELKETISRWEEKKNKTLQSNQLHLLHEIMTSKSTPKTKVALPSAEGLEFLEIKDIVRCESESNYTRLYCFDKTKHLICRTLKDVERVLKNNGFIRVHHSHLINPQYIRRFIRHDGGYIVMIDGEQISVSRTKKDRLFQLFDNIEKL